MAFITEASRLFALQISVAGVLEIRYQIAVVPHLERGHFQCAGRSDLNLVMVNQVIYVADAIDR